ncbi:MAG: aminodeoxychorismate/anthranilate synthase component II [Rhodospirillales bacterium]|nr:aminodeoxychorismate/anthranilate synthase component II [Rhodospirillales bacterium]
MILLIDNYDSFVHNLARHIGILGHERRVVRNDAIQIPEIINLKPEAILLSPGPMSPRESGICLDVLRCLGPTIPVLGICLGHECIAEAFGGQVGPAQTPMHGRSSAIEHGGRGLFTGLPSPFQGGRYHSLSVTLPANSPLMITATSEDGEIMGLKHAQYPIYGLQFHPESILTEHGLDLLRNFMTLAQNWTLRRADAA